ncbi:MAG: hypothetical protein HS108_14020 [Planctomycetes bacterium]|nr:hypothetical protein [Planctomycetota bacterium]MCL4731130.1 hypothetical protein [Planctomycetota bacterium]
MKNSIMLALLCVLAVFAVACGSGNNAKGGPGGNSATGDSGKTTSDPYALYKNKGWSWTVKNEMDAGGTKMVTHSKTEVVEVAADHAMIKMWTLDADMKPMAGMPEPTPTKIEFKTADAPAGNAPKVETKEETVEVKAGKFECTVTENAGTKTWMSKEYPGLMVKMESATMKSELIEFKK